MSRQRTSDILLKIAARAADKGMDLAMCFLDPYGVRGGKVKPSQLSEIVSKKAINNAARRLREKGCLEKIEKNGKITYKITEKGRNIIEKFLFDREKWDGQWRVVIYDISEENRRIRDIFRAELRASGFKQLQKSVWVSPFDVLSDIKEALRKYDLHNDVWFLLSKSLMNDEEIIEKFSEMK